MGIPAIGNPNRKRWGKPDPATPQPPTTVLVESATCAADRGTFPFSDLRVDSFGSVWHDGFAFGGDIVCNGPFSLHALNTEAVATLLPEAYLPMDCPNCGRRRLLVSYDPNGKPRFTLRCEKCGATSFDCHEIEHQHGLPHAQFAATYHRDEEDESPSRLNTEAVGEKGATAFPFQTDDDGTRENFVSEPPVEKGATPDARRARRVVTLGEFRAHNHEMRGAIFSWGHTFPNGVWTPFVRCDGCGADLDDPSEPPVEGEG